MVLDRHDRLAGSLRKFSKAHKARWEEEARQLPQYCLKVSATAPHYLLGHFNLDMACHCRCIAAFLHWIILQKFLKKNLKDSEKGAFIGNVLGFPEIHFVCEPQTNSRSVVPFKVTFSYQENPADFLDFGIGISKLLVYDNIDLMKSNWHDPREGISELEDEGSSDRATNWVLQTQRKSSRFFKNRDMAVAPLWREFLAKSENLSCKDIRSEDMVEYPFTPQPDESLGQAIFNTQKFIDETISLHYQRLAKKWLLILIKNLFLKTNLTTSQEDIILSYFGIDHPSYTEKQMYPLTRDLSEYAIDYKRAQKYLDVLWNEYLFNVKKYRQSGELLLVLLIALQGAYRKPSLLSIQKILNLTTVHWNSSERSFVFGKECLEVSHGLSLLLSIFIPKGTKQKRKLFNISRSWINKHLKNINTHLGYDWDNDPVTAQTFLFQPHQSIGHRGKPPLWQVATRIYHYQCYRFSHRFKDKNSTFFIPYKTHTPVSKKEKNDLFALFPPKALFYKFSLKTKKHKFFKLRILK